jgi:hypothetical protein
MWAGGLFPSKESSGGGEQRDGRTPSPGLGLGTESELMAHPPLFCLLRHEGVMKVGSINMALGIQKDLRTNTEQPSLLVPVLGEAIQWMSGFPRPPVRHKQN